MWTVPDPLLPAVVDGHVTCSVMFAATVRVDALWHMPEPLLDPVEPLELPELDEPAPLELVEPPELVDPLEPPELLDPLPPLDPPELVEPELVEPELVEPELPPPSGPPPTCESLDPQPATSALASVTADHPHTPPKRGTRRLMTTSSGWTQGTRRRTRRTTGSLPSGKG